MLKRNIMTISKYNDDKKYKELNQLNILMKTRLKQRKISIIINLLGGIRYMHDWRIFRKICSFIFVWKLIKIVHTKQT